ncbi:chaplin [Embleya sp. AB8]|uniref:chaplin n=1 Tax=Embleya sp. AB8 TaxID=3156304 RepID=UPI003C7553D2
MNSFKKASVLAAGTAALLVAGTGAASASSEADATSLQSSGVASGNIGQSPFHTPAIGCSDAGNALSALNTAFGNKCQITETDNQMGNEGHDDDYGHEGHRPQGHPHGTHQHDDGHRSLLERLGI